MTTTTFIPTVKVFPSGCSFAANSDDVLVWELVGLWAGTAHRLSTLVLFPFESCLTLLPRQSMMRCLCLRKHRSRLTWSTTCK